MKQRGIAKILRVETKWNNNNMLFSNKKEECEGKRNK